MKRCPKCKRTYADDAFTFCLEDGALLSAPYDPEKKEEPISTILSGGPPPTAVLPNSASRSQERETDPVALSPTIAAPSPRSEPATTPTRSSGTAAPVRRRSLLPLFLAIALGVPIVAGGIYLAVLSSADCPDFVVVCSTADEKNTYCDLNPGPTKHGRRNDDRRISAALTSLRPMLGFQAPALPDMADVKWSTSAGTVVLDRGHFTLARIHTDDYLAGREITVTAKVSSKKWFCGKTVSTSFSAPTSLAPNDASPSR